MTAAASDRPRPGTVLRVLLIPADPARPTAVTVLPDTAAAFSNALGGVLLDTIAASHAGHRYSLYLPDDPTTCPDNPRAAALAARLGLHDRDVQARLRGDVLIAGLHDHGDDDQDVPTALLAAARRLWPVPEPVAVITGLTSPG